MNRQHRPRKRFGQHFLHDQDTIDRIVSTFNPHPGQVIIEIGPGRGALTLPLLQRIGELHVVELDSDLIAYLRTRCKDCGTLHIHAADALKFDFSRFSSTDLRIIGNLPYNISTPLLFHLLEYKDYVRDMQFMLQREVVERICSVPGRHSYGRLSVMLQYHYEVEQLFCVGPEVFTPPPRVDSAVVRLIPWSEPRYQPADSRLLSQIVKASFAQRRKTLRNALRGIITAEQLHTLGINPSSRAENLDVESFVSLANLCSTDRNQ